MAVGHRASVRRRALSGACCLLASLAALTSSACHRTAPPARVAASPAADDALPFVGAEPLLAEAEALWRARADEGALRSFIDKLERALVQRPAESALPARLARAYFLLGYAHARGRHDVPAMKQAFERGMLAAEQALGEASAPFRAAMDGGGAIEDALGAVDAAGLDALTWYVGCLGGYAGTKGNTVALFYLERLRRGLERLLALDEGYHFATPLRFYGAFLTKAPAFAGGSLRLAKVHFERALALAPGYLDNAVAYADFYARAKRDASLFDGLLRGAVAADPLALGEEEAPELRLQQLRAQALLTRGMAAVVALTPAAVPPPKAPAPAPATPAPAAPGATP